MGSTDKETLVSGISFLAWYLKETDSRDVNMKWYDDTYRQMVTMLIKLAEWEPKDGGEMVSKYRVAPDVRTINEAV